LEPSGIIVQDNTAPLLKGLREYFCWVDGNNWSILGNYVANSTRQHVIRGQDTVLKGVLIDGNNLTKTYPSDDPGEDHKTTINFRIGSYIFISNNVLSDSSVSLSPTIGQDTSLTLDWVVVQDNYINNTDLVINEIVHHMLVQDNVFNLSGDDSRGQIDIYPGTLSDPNGHITDITITQNTGLNTGTEGVFLWMYSQAAPGAITLTNNLYSAPNEQLAVDGSTALLINAPDLSGFAQISGNIWPSPTTSGPYGTTGVVNFVAGYASPNNFLTPAQWDAESNVSNDQFSDAPVATGTYQMTLNGITAGASGVALAA